MTARAAAAARLRDRGRRIVWQQANVAGSMSELDRAMFILDRLYPGMPARAREQVRARLAADGAAGSWHGFDRDVQAGTAKHPHRPDQEPTDG